MEASRKLDRERLEVKAVKIDTVAEEEPPLMTTDALQLTAKEACRPEITLPKVHNGVHHNRAIRTSVKALHHQAQVITDHLVKMDTQTLDLMIEEHMEQLRLREKTLGHLEEV